MEALKYLAIGFAVIFVGYVAIRLWSYGVFRSYYDAKKPHKDKEE